MARYKGLSKRQKSSPSRGWRKLAPKSSNERRAVKAVCGPAAFLQPSSLKYPIVGKYATKKSECRIDCGGLEAAMARARQQHSPKLAAKALRIATRLKCAWA